MLTFLEIFSAENCDLGLDRYKGPRSNVNLLIESPNVTFHLLPAAVFDLSDPICHRLRDIDIQNLHDTDLDL